MMNRRSGFVLVELMIVVATIAILAAIAVPAFLHYSRSAKSSEARDYLKVIAIGAKSFFDSEGRPAANLGELSQAGLVDDALGNGEMGGYDWVLFAGPESDFSIEGYPASPYAGSLNFFMDQTGTIRSSDDGRADVASPVVSTIDLDPGQGNPTGTPNCWYGPYVPTFPPRTPTPTTVAVQDEAFLALFDLPMGLLLDLAADFPEALSTASGMAELVWTKNWQTGPANAVQLWINSALNNIPQSANQQFHIEDLVTAPEGNFDSPAMILDVLNAAGGCVAACASAEVPGMDCNLACSEEISPIDEPQLLLHTYVTILLDSLDLGIACEQRPEGVPFAVMDTDALPFLTQITAALTPGVPALSPPLIGSLALGLAALGAWSLRRWR